MELTLKIDQEKCIKCGKCKSVCPYDAIAKKERPCQKACGVNAIKSDKMGRAYIDNEKCVSCGMCMVSCPFGAISDIHLNLFKFRRRHTRFTLKQIVKSRHAINAGSLCYGA